MHFFFFFTFRISFTILFIISLFLQYIKLFRHFKCGVIPIGYRMSKSHLLNGKLNRTGENQNR